jgi:hypothetical protein
MPKPNKKKTYKITFNGKTLEYCRTKEYVLSKALPKWKRIFGDDGLKIGLSNQSNP